MLNIIINFFAESQLVLMDYKFNSSDLPAHDTQGREHLVHLVFHLSIILSIILGSLDGGIQHKGRKAPNKQRLPQSIVPGDRVTEAGTVGGTFCMQVESG